MIRSLSLRKMASELMCCGTISYEMPSFEPAFSGTVDHETPQCHVQRLGRMRLGTLACGKIAPATTAPQTTCWERSIAAMPGFGGSLALAPHRDLLWCSLVSSGPMSCSESPQLTPPTLISIITLKPVSARTTRSTNLHQTRTQHATSSPS